MAQFEVERLSVDELRKLQSDRLLATLERVRKAAAPYWRSKSAAAGELRSIDDIRELPFTDKTEFRGTYPYGMLAVPRDQVVRVHASSGTSGKPTIVAYTPNDVAVFAEVKRPSTCAGGRHVERRRPRRIWIWALHRRAWAPLRCRGARSGGGARLRGQRRFPDRDPCRSRSHRSGVHAVVCLVAGRAGPLRPD